MYFTQKSSVSAIFATVQQPHSKDIFLNPKILPLDKLINQQEGILTHKVINGTYLLGDILTDRHDQKRRFKNSTGLNDTLLIIYSLIELSKLGIVYLRRVAFSPAQLVCLGVQLLLDRTTDSLLGKTAARWCACTPKQTSFAGANVTRLWCRKGGGWMIFN